jgi:group I intron endonuclease
MANLNGTYKYCYIYKIINLINKKCYVGFHVTNKEYDKDVYYGSSQLLKKAILKYGINNFVMGIIEYININEWQEKEKYWIKKMNSHVSYGGYNLTWGGDGTLGIKLKEETIIKLKSIVHKKMSEETKRKISKSSKGKPGWAKGRKLFGNALLSAQTAFSGKTHTDETKKKIGLKHKGKILSNETKLKLRNCNIGKLPSDETKEKISRANRGKIRTEESKKRYRLSKLGIKRPTKICPHCQREISDGNYSRWHGEKCKFK